MKIFIVDDSKVIRKSLVCLLSEVRNTEIVGQADRAEEALASIRSLKPDVVTLDIRMPGGSGMDIIKPIKEALSKVIVIILTNYPYPQYKEECLVRGADYFLDKSTEFEKIPKILEQWQPIPATGGL